MTYEEALRIVKDGDFGDTSNNGMCINGDCGFEGECEKCINVAFSLAYEALEKQIPKKPKEKENDIDMLCPICECYVGYMHPLCSIKHDYCINCGQRIDWSRV